MKAAYMYQITSDTKEAILVGQYCVFSLDKRRKLYITNDLLINESREHVGYFKNNNVLDLNGLPVLRCGFAVAFGKKGYKSTYSALSTIDLNEEIKKIDIKMKDYIFKDIDERYRVSDPHCSPSFKTFKSLFLRDDA